MLTTLHIGQHKTGTTSIQHYLQAHRAELSANGLYVPDSLLGYANPSHFLLNVYALEPERESTAKLLLEDSVEPAFFDTLAARLQDDIARHYREARALGCTEVLWTNEGLYLLDSEAEYRRLRALFDPWSDTVRSVCCFRDRDEYLASYRRQLASLKLPLSDDPRSTRYLEPDSWLVDYARKQALLASVFDEVLVLDYDPADMVRTFLDSLGYAASGDTAALRLNPSGKAAND